ncbi:unnamed protein product, partial [Ectocarpus sp. 8 AP-2014]
PFSLTCGPSNKPVYPRLTGNTEPACPSSARKCEYCIAQGNLGRHAFVYPLTPSRERQGQPSNGVRKQKNTNTMVGYCPQYQESVSQVHRARSHHGHSACVGSTIVSLRDTERNYLNE